MLHRQRIYYLFVNYNNGNKETTDGKIRVNPCKMFSEERQTYFVTYVIDRIWKTIVPTSDLSFIKTIRIGIQL